MTTLLTPVPTSGAPRQRRITVAEYHRMIATGILKEGEPIELLEGVLVFKMSRNPPHDTSMGKLDDAIVACLPSGWIRRVQSALTLLDSEPEPDFVLARGTRADYAARHPGAVDVGLVVEVSDSSLALDRGAKLRIYAAAAVALYWIVNIPDACIEVYTQPTGTGDQATYNDVQVFGPNDDITLTLGGVALPPLRVADILP